MKIFKANYNVDWSRQQIFLSMGSIGVNVNKDYYRELKETLKIKRVKNFSFVRVGKDNDGGYIMADNFRNNPGGGLHTLSVFQMMCLGTHTW